MYCFFIILMINVINIHGQQIIILINTRNVCHQWHIYNSHLY